LSVTKKKTIKHFRKDAELKEIGQNIKKFRELRGYTQSELAFMCGDKDWSQISRMERGVVNFSISYFLLVSEKLEVSAKDLLP